MDLSIIIVNYRTYDKTKQTINSVLKTIKDLDYEVILVDNNSSDGSLEKLEKDFKGYDNIIFIANSSNDGFAVANNIGYRKSSGEYILLLNSDVVLGENTVNNTLEYIKNNPNVGAIGPRVVLPDNSLDKACRRSFPTPIVSFYRMTGLSKLFPNSKRFNRYNLSYMDEHEVYPVDCIVGAYMLLKSSTYSNVGMLNEDYFMYGEDIDLCYEIKQSNLDVIYYGKNIITHYKGSSGKNKRLLYEFHNSMIIFYDKHYKKQYNIIVTLVTHFGIWLLYYLKLIPLYFDRFN